MPASAWLLTPVSTPCRWRMAITTSSSAALPARSPRPLTVVLAWVAPAHQAARVLAVARPRSLWAWISRPRSTSRRSAVMRRQVSKGSRMPSVSGVAPRARPPAACAAAAARAKKASSAREASSKPTLTSAPASAARCTKRVMVASTQARSRCSLRSIWMSEAEIDRCTMSASQRSAPARSVSHMRAQTMVRAFRPRRLMARISSISCSPMAGMPISISGTPAASNAWAMAIFSSSLNATPAVCSPSRKVVSLMVKGQVGSGVSMVSSCVAVGT